MPQGIPSVAGSSMGTVRETGAGTEVVSGSVSLDSVDEGTEVLSWGVGATGSDSTDPLSRSISIT